MNRQHLDIIGHIRRATGRQYPKLEQAIPAMSDDVVREFARLLADLRFEQDKAVNSAKLTPWR